MIVHFFTVTLLKDNPIKFDTIYAEFGQRDKNLQPGNIPQYLQYEGGAMGTTTFLCCVEIGVNVQEICKKYDCELGTLYKTEIKNDTYNNRYKVYPTYCRPSDGLKYKLRIP
jgi:hypothetical protein